MKINYFIKLIIATTFFGYLTVEVNAQHFTDFKFTETVPSTMQQRMANNAKTVFRELHEAVFSKKSTISLSSDNVTEDAKKRMASLWKTSKFYCRKTEIELPILRLWGEKGYQVRNIPVIFEAGETQEDKFQDIVLEFASDGKINDVYIAIPRHTIIPESITNVTDTRRRTLILDFVENYRTAYNRMDINYIESLFSNDALIIIGKMVDKSSSSELKPNVVYTVKSKEQYIIDLKRVFAANVFINVKFDEIKVTQHEDKDYIYGVTMKQQYKSSIYDDDGWLFLVIDFRDEAKPQIWVRTWQPLKVDRVFQLVHFPM